MDKIFSAVDERLTKNDRVLLAIAGPPAAGKSTISEQLMARYKDSVVVPMDGFHLDNVILDAKDLRARKGAPETFDAEGFVALAKRVAQGEAVYAPIFDRESDLSRASAIEVNKQKLIIFEGNYLLYNAEPWRALQKLWTLSIWLNLSLEDIEKRCIERWLSHGFDKNIAQTRARGNDIKNAEQVIAHKMQADIEI